MPATESQIPPAVAETDAANLLIDADVHEMLPNKEALLPYLAPEWRAYITDYSSLFPGVQAPSAFPYAVPSPGPSRLDWMTPNSIGEGRTPIFGMDELRSQLFEGERVTLAVLNGGLYPANLVGNYGFAKAMASAYNDWQIDTWLDKEPRLRGSVHVVTHDPQDAAREIDRVAQHPQIVQVHLPLTVERQYGDPFYRPIFEAAVRNGLVVSLHHDRCTRTVFGYPRNYIEWKALSIPQAAMSQTASMICNGLFDKYPELKVVLLETGVAWVPWLMWRLDEQYKETRVEVPWVKRLPSEHMRDSIRIATQPMGDITTRQFTTLVEMIDGECMYMFATDYPHADADTADTVLPKSMSEDLRSRIRYRNALETYPRLAGLAL